jgi:hypothetical protein
MRGLPPKGPRYVKPTPPSFPFLSRVLGSGEWGQGPSVSQGKQECLCYWNWPRPRIEWRDRAKFSCRARHAVPLLKTNNAIARQPSIRKSASHVTCGTGRNACATGRRKFKRAGPANSIGTQTARRMLALRGKRLRRTNAAVVFLLVATARSCRVGAQEAYATERRVSGLRLLFCAVRLFRGRSFRVLFFARGS